MYTISKILAVIALSISGITFAQSATTQTSIHSDGSTTTLSWGGLNWQMPTRFFMGIRPDANGSKEFWIQFGWEKINGIFSPIDANMNDMKLTVHIRKLDDLDPRNALALIHRINLPFDREPKFSAGKFNGMTYLGSSVGEHYFALNNENAYVSCRLIDAGRLMPPQVAPDILSKKFTCQTMLFLPHNTYAWFENWGVDLNDIAPAFIATHRQILSYIRQ